MGLDAHSAEQGRLLEAHVLARRAELAREADDPWSAAGPHSVSPFVPCAPSRIPIVLQCARLAPDDVLWDLGCGDGRVLLQAAAQYGCRCVGVDIDARCIRDARASAAEQGAAERCAFFACDLLRLAPGALLRGVLGEAAEPAARALCLPPPTCAIVFVTGHALSRLSAFLHAEWAGASGALRLLTCVEALDACVDFERSDALFADVADRPAWPVSRHAERDGVFVVPPFGTAVRAWEAASPPWEPRPPLTRAQADAAEPAVLRGLLSAAEVAQLLALGDSLLHTTDDERAPAADAAGARGDISEALAALDLFAAGASATELASAAEDACHRCAQHRVLHLHRAARLERALPALLPRLLNRLRAADSARWRLLRGRSTSVRSAEFHAYELGGSVADPEHRDAGSLLTLSVALSRRSDFDGGELLLWREAADGSGADVGGGLSALGEELAPGDGVLFPSEKRHNVTPVTRGGRRAFIVELWAGPANEHNRHR
ncbi:hypothetical protein KFE25_004084 [Diacronema lutheri]|uniref:Fe2OG dioxygenase domain-containing protein n=1 Tax=Diacronema lutheri TaxID=2081491 RepID=A0A8J5X8V2_DIALT|nr:hypothetical protein KFE25_004084 [Diacronema lutheri]